MQILLSWLEHFQPTPGSKPDVSLSRHQTMTEILLHLAWCNARKMAPCWSRSWLDQSSNSGTMFLQSEDALLSVKKDKQTNQYNPAITAAVRFLGSHNGIDKHSSLLRCYTALLGKQLHISMECSAFIIMLATILSNVSSYLVSHKQ
jgi:hypothetical protein